MKSLLPLRKASLLSGVVAAAVVAAPAVDATPIGEVFDFGFEGFQRIDGSFTNQDGEPGEEGGQFGPFVFGTPASLSLFGNALTFSSSVTDSGPGEQTWVFSLVADDGGPLFDPQAGFEGVDFFAFRTIGIGADGTTSGGTATDPIFSPLQIPTAGFVFNPDAIEIFDSNGELAATRNIFSITDELGTRLHIGFTSAPTSEIVISGGGDVPADASELRVTLVTSVVPEPGSLALLAVGSVAMLRRRR